VIGLSWDSIAALQARFAKAVGDATVREDGPLLYVRLDAVDAALISYCMGCASAEFLRERPRKKKRRTKKKAMR
jgi:hypothetical protein